MNKIKILIPVYNDWQSVFKLIENINSQVSTLNDEFSVIIINDASTENRPEFSVDLNNLNFVQIINMKENKGHARCNAAGLKYISEKEDFDYVIPMDGDGEDRPEELSLLIEKIKEYPNTVITGNRVKRFQKYLQDEGYVTTIRSTRGDDIMAACGQLVGQVNDKTRRKQRAQKNQIKTKAI